jgi:hypothetical protein
VVLLFLFIPTCAEESLSLIIIRDIGRKSFKGSLGFTRDEKEKESQITNHKSQIFICVFGLYPYNPTCGVEQWQLVGLITRRS